MKPSEASKKLEFHSKQICHGCMHPSMVGWCENHCQLPEAFKMAISALEKQEQDRWIPCKERLPEYGTEVLTQLSGNEIVVNWVIDEEDAEWFEDGVLAWRPLPETYTEEES